MSIIQGTALSAGGFYPYELNQSLRFNDDDSAYLSWTPASAGNRKTWTWSGWVKRGNISSYQTLFWAGTDANNRTHFGFDNADKLRFYHAVSANYEGVETLAVYRDVSSWYHIVFVLDTTLASSELDRAKIYVNGVLQATSETFGNTITQNEELDVNSTQLHSIGDDRASSIPFDGYLSEVNFIDGTALDADSFGELKDGIWVPKAFAGTYGTNGFYLPFNNDYTVEGFNTVTYRGNGGTQYVGGVGFEPDLVWIKSRGNSTAWHALVDSVRGNTKFLYSNITNAEATSSVPFKSFDTDGFTVGSDTTTARTNVSGETYVAWCWDAGTGSPVSNTDGSITSTVKANPTYGQSIVSYAGNGSSNQTVGHGLSQAPEIKIIKDRDAAYSWTVTGSILGVDQKVFLDTTNAKSASVGFYPADTSSILSISGVNSAAVYNTSGHNYIAYCFHSVAGYSDFGSYTGNGSSTGPTVTTGFKPAFVMIKRTDVANNWIIVDNTRDPDEQISKQLLPNVSDAEYNVPNTADFLSNGFQLTDTNASRNANGGTYIYMAFADKREAAFWLDQSGNNNDWTNNNMQESDISLDNPTNNFATLNPLSIASGETQVLEEGNLNCTNSSSNYGSVATTIGASSGKWYCEGVILTSSAIASSRTGGGVLRYDDPRSSYIGAAATGWGYGSGGVLYNLGNNVTGVSTLAVGDVFMLAIDIDDGKMWIGKNGTWESSGDPAAGTGAQSTNLTGAGEYFFGAWSYTTSDNTTMNFGQDSSFAGNKVAQGNTDANGRGDFYYEPPAGYLALCTANLPEPAILDGSEHFNTVLYTGDGNTRSLTGINFQPDWVWIKRRNLAAGHYIEDIVRGAGYRLCSNNTDAEEFQRANGYLTSFDSDGFTVTAGSSGIAEVNASGDTYVAWNWKADNTSGTTNTDGSITSTVSANTTAGFSIVNFVSTGSAGTVGHGLSQAPELIIAKQRPVASAWAVYSAEIGATKRLQLQTTDAAATDSSWNNTAPTSSVFSQALTGTAGRNIICYCFHSVEGYSKFGSYTGNGSADGPFVYTGFRPAFVMVKRTDNTGNWLMQNNKALGYNPSNSELYANLSNTEITTDRADFLSNGFKPRVNSAENNASGSTYIYMAFAEMPFRYSNAR